MQYTIWRLPEPCNSGKKTHQIIITIVVKELYEPSLFSVSIFGQDPIYTFLENGVRRSCSGPRKTSVC